MILLFWACVFLLAWHYIGYPILLWFLCKKAEQDKHIACDDLPAVSIIIASYNEQERITRRIENCLSLDYPRDRLEIIVGSDGSTDGTVEIARRFEPQGVKVLDFSENRGRSQVHNDCARAASGEILCFTDADTLYRRDCIRIMVRHYADPRVGCVGGALCSGSFEEGALGEGQGLYWKWEYALRKMQSALGVLTKTSGANMSMRKDLYQDLPCDIDIDQAAGPIVLLQGFRVVHEHDALAFDEFTTTARSEFATRRRFALRALTALWRYREILNPFLHPALAFHTISYRLLRYVAPFLLCALFLSNLFLVGENRIYGFLFDLQCVFYLFAFFGFLMECGGRKPWRIFSFPFAFVLANLGMLYGAVQFLSGRRIRSYKTR